MHSVHNISKPSRKREDCGHYDIAKDDIGKDEIGKDEIDITVCIVASHVFGGMQLQ